MTSKKEFWGMSGQSPVNCLAERLCASLQPRSPIEFTAELAADGNDDKARWALVRQRSVRTLRRINVGNKVEEDNLSSLSTDIQLGAIKLFASKGLSVDDATAFLERLTAATGPFHVLAIGCGVGKNSEDLIEFSKKLDETANQLVNLELQDQLNAANLLLMNSTSDEEYLCWPESTDVDSTAPPQKRIKIANSWEEFNEQLAIYGRNAFLSWISKLDVECTCHWFSDVKPFPLFLPLLAGATPPTDLENPVKNLIKLLENIQTNESPKSSPPQASDTWWSRSRLGLQDLLSTRQFHELLQRCGANRQSENAPFIGVGLQLLVAANAFSLLTLRDGKGAQIVNRRKKPAPEKKPASQWSDVCRQRYLFWWLRHRKAAEARGAATGTRPWPAWFSQSVCDAGPAGF